MSAQEHYHFTLNGLETFDWQPTSSGVRLDLRERKVMGEHFLCTQLIWGHWNVTWRCQLSRPRRVAACWKASCESRPPLCSAAPQSKPKWPQNYSWPPLSNAHLCILYIDITGDPRDSVLLYNTSTCTVQSQTQGCSDQRSPADKCNQWCASLGGFTSLPLYDYL